MALQRILAMLQTCTTDAPLFPPTTLYNDTWLLRLLLNWFSAYNLPEHPLAFPEETQWYSEGRLPSAFLKRYADDRLAEKHTQADAVIGHIDIGHKRTKTMIALRREARHFVVVEAKLFSRLASGTRQVAYFDQAARSVACIAETLRRANRYPLDMQHIGFYVLAPQSQIDQGVFAEHMAPDSIQDKVKTRVSDYKDGDGYKEKKQWLKEWFQPTLQQIDIRTIAWEALITTMAQHDPAEASVIQTFYGHCLEYT